MPLSQGGRVRPRHFRPLWRRRESNPQPQDYESCALPNCATPLWVAGKNRGAATGGMGATPGFPTTCNPRVRVGKTLCSQQLLVNTITVRRGLRRHC